MSLDCRICVFCQKQVQIDEDSVKIKSKGAEGIIKASSIGREDVITVTAGVGVHKKGRMNYINKKSIAIDKKVQSVSAILRNRPCYAVLYLVVS